jgi:glycosyltransferase involved in cell wall biosynthesis
MSKAGKKPKHKPKAPPSPDWAGRPDPAAFAAAVRAAAGSSADPGDEFTPAEMAKRFGTIRGALPSPFPPGTLTVAMIVKNEAKNIKDAVESFRPIADEIVVYDTGSTDGTQEILAGLGVRWIQGEWRNDFAWARNRSIETAKSAWILWLDADDRIPADQVENFRKLKTAPLDRAFGFQVINTQGGLPIGGRFMQLRMFPNHPGLRFRYKVHEQLMHAVAGLGLHTFWTETTIHHTGYEDAELKKKKALRNLLLLEEDPARVAREPSLAMAIGDSYYILGEFEKGIEAYKRTMAMPDCEAINRDIYRELPCCIGQGYQHLGRREEALGWYDQSIALQPDKHESYFHKARCLMEMGRTREAEALYLKLIRMPVSFSTTSNQYDLIQIYSRYYAAGYAFGRGEIAGAKGLLEALLEKYPQVVEGWQLLGKCRLAEGDPAAAEKCWAKAIVLNPPALPDLHAQHLVLLRRLDMRAGFDEALAAARALFPGRRFPEWRDLEAAAPGNSGVTIGPSGPGAESPLRPAPGGPEPSASGTPEPSASGAPERPALSGSERPALSLCMIVKNEKDNLPACLESAQGLADEIIVVDTGSGDGTQDIARRFGAKVIQSDWRGDFSLARNESIDAATGRWILWLDADDRLLPEDKRALRALAASDPALAPKAYGLRVKNSRDGGLTGSVFNQIRMFPNLPALRFRAPVHEQILPALEEAGIPVEYAPIRVLHTGYADPALARSKQERNKAILESQIRAGQGITPVTLYTLACACADLGEHAAAVDRFREAAALARSTGSDPHIAEGAPAKAAASLASLGRHAEALAELAPCLAVPRPVPEAVLVKAQVEAAAGRKQAARPWYERLLELEETGTFLPVDFQLLKIQALQWLGQYWFDQGRRDLAVELLKAGLAIKEGGRFAPADLAAAYRRHGAAP